MQQRLTPERLVGQHAAPTLAVLQQASAGCWSWLWVMQQQRWTLQAPLAQQCVWSPAACQLALLSVKKTGQAERAGLNLENCLVPADITRVSLTEYQTLIEYQRHCTADTLELDQPALRSPSSAMSQ